MRVVYLSPVASAKPVSACPICRADIDASARYCGGCGAAIANTKSAEHTAEIPEAIGREVAGRYRILAKLGEGGMGAVYRAEQISLKREVALKVLKPELSAEAGLVRRFNAEAELAAKLNHPHTVTLYDFGQEETGALFIAMELISGCSLRQELVRSGPLRLARVVDIGSQICASLADAHATGIVHRDLKPDNVMLSERGRKTDNVTVLDFGIAKLRDQKGDITQQPMTRAGDILGTPQYMAPEQIRGLAVDARTDIYALGVMLYEMITARLPFDGNSVMALLSKHLTDTPVAPAQRRPELGISPSLSQLVMDCLAKEPAARPATMDHVEQALAAALAGEATSNAQRAGHDATPLHSQQHVQQGQASLAPQSAVSNVAQATGWPAPLAAVPVPSVLASPVNHQSYEAAPQQFTASQVPRGSKRALWIVLALVLSGAGAAGIYVAVAADKNDETEQEPTDFDLNAWENDVREPGQEPAAPPQELEKEPADFAEDLVHVDPTYGYRVTLPASFTSAASAAGTSTFVGLVNDNSLLVQVTALPLSQQLSERQIEREISEQLADKDLAITSHHWIGQGLSRQLEGTVLSLEDQQEGDFQLKIRGSMLYFIVIGGDPEDYQNTAAFRQSFLKSGFATH